MSQPHPHNGPHGPNQFPQNGPQGQGGPHYAAYPPQPQQPSGPPPKQKKPVTKRWWFWVLLAIVGIGLLSRCGGGGSTTATTPAGGQTAPAGDGAPAQATTQAAAPKKTEAPMPGLNTAVKAGDVEFTVTSFKCDVTVKDITKTLEPQGKFCLLTLSAKNVGTKQVTLSDSNIKVLDEKGAEYKPSSDTLFVEGTIFLKAINPGNAIKGNVYVDVPKEVTPVQAVVADNMFAKGSKIKLA